jgi:hypothetical protein
MCSGSRQERCWNSIGFNGPLSAQRIVKITTSELYKLDGLADQFQELVRRAAVAGDVNVVQRWEKLSVELETLAKNKENVKAAIAAYGPGPLVKEQLDEITAKEQMLARERRGLERLKERAFDLPQSVEALRQLFEEKFARLTMSSPELGDLLRNIVPEFYVFLVRLVDGGHLMPRAYIRLDLGGIIPDAKHVAGLPEIFCKEWTLDLFERPPQRERIRQEAVRLEAAGTKQREIASLLEENPKQAVVQRALALDRRMRQLGLESPYIAVTEPPEDYPKLRRHRNGRYSFSPLVGFPRAIS